MDSEKRPLISVIIPTLNGEQSLPEVLAALRLQQLQPDEILVGDSESSDATAEICTDNGARLIPVKRREFDHGGTRSYLAQQARGSLLVFLTQDAILAGPDDLGNLIESLMADAALACAYGRQLPQHNATLLSAHLRTFNYPPESSVRSIADKKRYGLKTIFISNSFAAYKKEILADNGYFTNGLIFGEDTCTLGRLLLAGYKVAYCAEARVYHSHNYTIAEEFKRSFDIGVLHSSESWLLDSYGSAEKIGSTYVRSAWDAIIREKRYELLPDWFCRIGSKYMGYKLGRIYKRLPEPLRPLLSMHSLWWDKKH